MRIKIIICTQDVYRIEPLKENQNSYSRDLSIELATLKTELEKSEKNLIEGRDYTIDRGPYPNTDPAYQIKFTGKTQVLRALFAIPVDWIDFSKSYPVSSKETLQNTRSSFAMAISERECTVFDLPIVENIHNDLLNSLIEQIKIVHQNNKKPSAVIDQLTQDLILINKNKNQLWGNSNFYLSCAALYHAMITEKQSPTIQTGALCFLGRGESVLYPEYHKIFSCFTSYFTSCKGYNPNHYGENKFQFLESNYYPQVKSLQPNALSSLVI